MTVSAELVSADAAGVVAKTELGTGDLIGSARLGEDTGAGVAHIFFLGRQLARSPEDVGAVAAGVIAEIEILSRRSYLVPPD